MELLGGRTPAEFLREHWQKRPLLVRGAFPCFESPLDGDELAGLACDPDVESRIVVTHDGPRYETVDGPFTADAFAEARDTPWTLLVQDVDKHLPDLAAWLEPFAFLPEWRLEDLMVSWASDGGSVGPHTDQYDVFLLQAAGKRRWLVGERGAEDDHVLEPGDMLYLPPGVRHHGIAVDGPCMTWSIGLRAPSVRELVSDFAERAVALVADHERYGDPDLDPAESADGRLGDATLARAFAALDGAHARARAHAARWLGELVTAPKAWLHCVPPPIPLSRDALAERIRAGAAIVRDPRSRMVWVDDAGALRLCVDGDSFEVPADLQPLLVTLCTRRRFAEAELSRYLDDDDAMAVLVRLYAGGQLLEVDDA